MFLTRPTERGGNLDGAANRTRGPGDCSGCSGYRRPPARPRCQRAGPPPAHSRNKSRPRAGRLGHPRTRLGARWGFGFAGLPAPPPPLLSPPLGSRRRGRPLATARRGRAADGWDPQQPLPARTARRPAPPQSPRGARGSCPRGGVPRASKPREVTRKGSGAGVPPSPPREATGGGQGATPFPRRSAGLLERRRAKLGAPEVRAGAPAAGERPRGGGVTARNLRAAASAQTSPLQLKASTFQTPAAGQEVRA